ncbi:MAG TPA: hypothetical protein VKE51_39075 [Vicinamibacterales bacterium]|nr:hypothetical protein [Vicinamibacterales bacterium]
MSSTNKTSPVASGTSRPVNRQIATAPRFAPVNASRVTDVPAPQVRGPVVPPVFRPAKPASKQPGLAAAQSVQRASGGKAGVGYTSIGASYSQDQIAKALNDLGMQGTKGHNKGQPGSGESGQTKNENKKLAEQLRKNKADETEKAQTCRKFHNKRNNGQRCKGCNQIVDV